MERAQFKAVKIFCHIWSSMFPRNKPKLSLPFLVTGEGQGATSRRGRGTLCGGSLNGQSRDLTVHLNIKKYFFASDLCLTVRLTLLTSPRLPTGSSIDFYSLILQMESL